MSVESDSGSESVERLTIDDVQHRLSELSDSAPNEQVERLLDALEWFVIDHKRLEAQNRRLERRVEHLEAVTGLSGDELDLTELENTDHRDRKVLKAIVASETDTFSLRDLQRLYRQHTDVRNTETMKDRIRHLTSTARFEHAGSSRWRFVGGSGSR